MRPERIRPGWDRQRDEVNEATNNEKNRGRIDACLVVDLYTKKMESVRI